MTIPAFPQTQALSSATFKPPLLDGSLTLPEIHEWHAKNSSNHRVFIYVGSDGTKRSILWPEAVKAALTGTRLVHGAVGGNPGDVVAILAASDSISYYTLIMSIMRANYVVFPLSPRNSPAALAHLITKVGVKHILVGREPAMGGLTKLALQALSQQVPSADLPSTSPIPVFEDLFVPTGTEETIIPYNRKPTDIAWYLHSSGSTAFPKPVPWTHYRLAQGAVSPWFGEKDLTDLILCVAAMPFFHGMGAGMTALTASCGIVLSTFEPKVPSPMPSPDSLIACAKETDSDYIFCVPIFIEAWRHRPDYVKWLATRTGVLYSGGPLSKDVGDYMFSQGVSVIPMYGSTEGGFMSTLFPSKVDEDWEFFRLGAFIEAEMVPYGDGTFEFVFVENDYCSPTIINTNAHGKNAYATSDLLIPHPTKSGFWKIHGRADDQIMHNTGEKTNPGPLEGLMNRHPKVLSAVIFGRGRFQAGIVVDPKPDFRFDPSDEQKLAEFRNELWPVVEKLNAFAPKHSRLFKEMIIVSKPSKPFTYTAKGTARRNAVINDYEEEIDQLYERVEESAQGSIPPPAIWDSKSTLEFVRSVVHQVVRSDSVGEDDDIFDHGCDSLQATWIRNSLLRALRDSAELDTRERTDNFVYHYPTITKLSAYVLTVASGNPEEKAFDKAKKVEEIQALVNKYASNLPKPSVDQEVVLLVGSTGAIGSQILAALAANTTVHHVYALNRTSAKASLKDRQGHAFAERGLPLELLQSPKISLLEADFQSEALGLEKAVYDKLQQTVTRIIHSAWRVDFNLSLTSFESNIKLLRRIIDFAVTAHKPPRFIFISSIGVLRNTSTIIGRLAEHEVPVETALGNGYSESKWAAEAILERVRQATGLETLVVRLGQVAGASNGAWNAKEWFPSLVQASVALGSLPTFEGEKVVSWISAQTAGQSLSELTGPIDNSHFAHIVHPRPVPWSKVASIIASELNLKLVPYTSWLEKLEAEAARCSKLNAAVLLPFFKASSHGDAARPDHHEEAFGLPDLDFTNAASASETLQRLESIGERDVKAWIGYWRQVGLF